MAPGWWYPAPKSSRPHDSTIVAIRPGATRAEALRESIRVSRWAQGGATVFAGGSRTGRAERRWGRWSSRWSWVSTDRIQPGGRGPGRGRGRTPRVAVAGRLCLPVGAVRGSPPLLRRRPTVRRDHGGAHHRVLRGTRPAPHPELKVSSEVLPDDAVSTLPHAGHGSTDRAVTVAPGETWTLLPPGE